MVAIVAGAGLGLFNSSAAQVGSGGLRGNGTLGQTGGQATVNIATGNLILQYTDETLSGTGADLHYLRTYNSQGSLFGSNADADGWREGGFKRLEVLAGQVNTAGSAGVARYLSDGSRALYLFDEDANAYFSPDGAGAHDKLCVVNADGSSLTQPLQYDTNGDVLDPQNYLWAWTDGQSTEYYQFDGDHLILRSRDPSGNGFDYVYGGDGTRLESVADLRSGQTFNYVYGTSGVEDGRLVAIHTRTTATAEQIGQVYYGYDTLGRLQTVTVDLSADNDITDGDVYTTTYTYDGDTARVATLTHSDGSTVSITYQDVDGTYRVQTVADQNGLTTFGYDTVNRTTTVSNQEGEVWTYTYDALGRLSGIESSAVNGVTESTHFSYNDRDDLIALTDGKGNAIHYYYDSRGNRVLEVDAEGNYLVKTYSYQNDLLSETRYVSASQAAQPAPQALAGDPLPTLPADVGPGLTTHYIYDEQRRLRFTVSPEGRVTENQYNAFGQLENTLAYDGTFNPQQLDAALDFSQLTHTDFITSENTSDQVTVLENGQALRLDGSTWIAVPQAVTITEHTILEFDFESTVEGDHHTIGFTNSLTGITYANHFKVFGSQSTSTLNTDYQVYQSGDGVRHFRIAVGQYFTGEFANLAFINDDDANAAANSIFSHVRLYDEDALQAEQVARLTAWTDSAAATRASQTQFSYDYRGNLSRQISYASFDANSQGIEDDAASIKEYVYDQHGQLLNEIVVRGQHRTQAAQQNNFPDDIAQDRHFYDDQQRLRFVVTAQGQVIEHRYDSLTGQRVESIAYEGQFALDSLGDTLDFAGATFVDFGPGENVSDNYSITGSGEGVSLADNTWKAIDHPYTVTENTWLEFDFASTVEGEHHTIGFANSLTGMVYDNHFKLYGSQSTSTLNTVYQTYDGSGNTVHYRIPVGDYYTGAFQYLAFINDDDANVGAQSVFNNVRLYEEAPAVDGSSQIAQLSAWTQGASAQPAYLTTFEYNGDNTLATRTDYSSVDASGQGVLDYTTTVTSYSYDSLGELTGETSTLVVDAPIRTSLNSFTYDGLGRLLTTSNASGTSTTVYNDSSRQIVVTNQAGLVTTQTFDTRGQLQTIQQSDSITTRATTYVRDAAGRLRMTEDAEGGRSWVFYDDAGRVSHRVARDGAVTEYRYDKNGQRLSETQYANRIDMASTAGWFTGATDWWNDGSVTKDELVLGVDYTADSDDRITRYDYDDVGRLIKTTDSALASSVSVYDGLSRIIADTTGVDIDTAGFTLWSQWRAAVPPAYSDTALYYLATQAIDNGQSEEDFLTTLQNADGAQLQAMFSSIEHLNVDQLRQTRYFYDDDGLQSGSLDAEGYLTENHYDGVGRLTSTDAYELQITDPTLLNGDFADLLAYAQTGSALTTRYFYDGLGRQVATLNEQGFLSTITYDQVNNQRTDTTYLQPINFADGDTLQDLITKAAANDGRWLVSLSQFDAFGRIQTTTAADGSVSRNLYDAAGRLVRTIVAEGTVEQRSARSVYNAFGEVTAELGGVGDATLSADPDTTALNVAIDNYGTRYTLDGLGRRIQSQDANGNATLFYYDNRGRLTHTINAVGQVNATSYNAFGQVDSVRTYASLIDTTGLTGGVVDTALQQQLTAAQDNARDSVESYAYDSRGQRVQTVRAEGGIVTTQYNLFGETVRQSTTDTNFGLTSRTDFVRDKLGQVIERIRAVDGTVTAATLTQYDAFGRVTRATDANGQSTVTQYLSGGREIVATDPLDRTVRTQFDALGRTLITYDGFNNATTYTYDDANRATTVTTAQGISVTTVNNRHGQTYTVTDGRGGVTTYTYNADGQLLTKVDAENQTVEDNTYDNGGRLFQSVDGNGTVTEFHYDAVNRVLQRIVDPGGLALTTEYQFDLFDERGLRTRTIEAAGTAEAKVTDSIYDRDGRQVQTIVDPDGLALTTTFTYDTQGNTRTMARGDIADPEQEITEYDFDLLGRRTRETLDPAGLALTTDYRYDANGNVTRRIDANGHSTWFVYDDAGQNIVEINAEGSLTQRVYDLNGRLVATRQYADPVDTAALAGQDVISELPPIPVASDADQLTYHVYDRDGRERFVLTATDNQNGATRWSVSENRYDANDNIVETRQYGQYLNSDMINDYLAQSGLSESAIYAQLNGLTHTPASAPVSGIELDQGADIGQVGAAGSTQYDAATGVYTVSGSGANIDGTRDEFHYAYTQVQGDFDARVRVVGISQGGALAKAGLMIRNSLADNSIHASAFYIPGDQDAAFQSRSESSGVTIDDTLGENTTSTWVRLVREGDAVTAYASRDGQTWILLDTRIVPMDESVYLGLAVTSVADGSLAEASFDNFSVWNDKVTTEAQPISGVATGSTLADNLLTDTVFIGGEDSRGSAQYDAATGTFTVSSAGTRLSGKQESFQFAYIPVAGDFDAKVHLASMGLADYWSRAGLMLRENLTYNSRYTGSMLTAHEATFQSRSQTEAYADIVGSTDFANTSWLRLVRQGDQFTSYASNDGVSWTELGSGTVAFDSEVAYLGLAVTSANRDVLIDTQFDNFSVTGEAVQFSQTYEPPVQSLAGDYTPIHGLSEQAIYHMLNALGYPSGSTGGGSAGPVQAVQDGAVLNNVEGIPTEQYSVITGPEYWNISDPEHISWTGDHWAVEGDSFSVFAPSELEDPNSWTLGYRPDAVKVSITAPTSGTFPASFNIFLVDDLYDGIATQYDIEVASPGEEITVLMPTDFANSAGTNIYALQILSSFGSSEWTVNKVELITNPEGSETAGVGTFESLDLSDNVLRSTAAIGNVQTEGRAQYDSQTGTYTMTGSGAYLSGTNDEFQFTYEPIVGDFDARVRVTDIENIDPLTTAGLMIRDSLDANSKHVSAMFTADNVAKYIARTSSVYSRTAQVPGYGCCVPFSHRSFYRIVHRRIC